MGASVTEWLALLLTFLAAAVLYGAGTERGRARWVLLGGRRRAGAARVLAFAAVAAAVWLWRSLESGAAAFLVVVTGLMVMMSVVALLGRVLPRLIWAAAVLSMSAIPFLVALWGAP
jgi:hypothetical protein